LAEFQATMPSPKEEEGGGGEKKEEEELICIQ
jgi:hypothetical protein